ncbi:ORF5a protein [Pebjah virus]|uniref:ORF5a protein n=1 Tax=Pebjah virus TaxID=1658615 RepID=A0A0G2UPV1_9NIDO|nr:ORF5a protein [Pebjah virus]AKI29936.1 ORF5a protein [Pebjah virus]AKI29951.1 ORF5a protein [Pebjah virus]AKI29966.1 ORF5a protein [Pebjah virus]
MLAEIGQFLDSYLLTICYVYICVALTYLALELHRHTMRVERRRRKELRAVFVDEQGQGNDT